MKPILFWLTIGLAWCHFLSAEEAKAPTSLHTSLWSYDANPDHPWNRLNRSLFVRTSADGREFTHHLDPLYWPTTKHLLKEPSHHRAIAALDDFIAKKDDAAIQDPLKRALLLRDLWALFDWNAWTADDWVHLSEHAPASRALRERLAIIIKRLALTGEQIQALPDNYSQAVQSKAFPARHEKGTAFLPPDLFSAEGPWVNFAPKHEALVRVHTKTFGGRSVFFTFLNLPGGRAATEDFIKKIDKDGPRLPDGTQVALVRRAMVIDAAGQLVPTRITETVQIRVLIKVPVSNDAKEHRVPGGEMDVMEFMLDRTKLFSGVSGGLVEVGKLERAFNFISGVSSGESFEAYKNKPPPDPIKEMRETLGDCRGCHAIDSLISVKNELSNSGRLSTPVFESYNQKVQGEVTAQWKQSEFNWGLLRGWFESLK
jgi:hypothetical protein